jgi:hypothetical protein
MPDAPHQPLRQKFSDLFRNYAIQLQQMEAKLTADAAHFEFWGDCHPVTKNVLAEIRIAKSSMVKASAGLSAAQAAMVTGAMEDPQLPVKNMQMPLNANPLDDDEEGGPF